MTNHQMDPDVRRAVFLDRDGTLNHDPGYINDPALFDLFPGVGSALRRLKEAGFFLILITNQSGIARGLISPENLEAIHAKLQALLLPHGVQIDAIYVCPHHPEFPPERPAGPCGCRKPSPGLAEQAIADWQIDRAHSLLIGDRPTDVLMGWAAGLTPILISSAQAQISGRSVVTAPTLGEAVDWILENFLPGVPGTPR
jgi:D,D-heptose 1,7-bisphosphate phosphatase